MGKRSYEGPALDASWQYIGERPELEEQAESVVYATDPTDAGEETVENVPKPTSSRDPDLEGQTSISDWRGGRDGE